MSRTRITTAARADTTFELDVRRPFARVAPLFGAWAERSWAQDGWSPRFVYPEPPRDEAGEVFLLDRGREQSTWVNTVLDPARGEFQYVYVTPGVMAVLIDIHATPRGRSATHVRVRYRRTALHRRHHPRVAKLGLQDRAAGPEWAAQLEAALPASPPSVRRRSPAAGRTKEGLTSARHSGEKQRRERD